MPAKNKKKKVLIIDDDEISLKFATAMLQDDYEVTTAKSGETALAQLQHFRSGFTPDIILLDIIMPYMDGWETFNRIRGISLLKNVPIIFLTSATEAEFQKRAEEIGAKDYITKPYAKEDLITRIKAALKNKEEIKK